jgi:hypothetical protein
MELQDFVTVKHELDFYLVEHRLKPAAIVSLSGRTVMENYTHSRDVTSNGVVVNGFMPDLEMIESFGLLLDQRNIVWQPRVYCRSGERDSDDENNETGIPEYYFGVGLGCGIASCIDYLYRLIFANSKYKEGIVLGYPRKEVAFFCSDDGARKSFVFETVSFKDDEKTESGVPIWEGYLDYLPSVFDSERQETTKTARDRGLRHMRYVRRYNPDLAGRVEDNLREGA